MTARTSTHRYAGVLPALILAVAITNPASAQTKITPEKNSYSLADDVKSRRGLHPGIGHHNPDGAEMRAERHHAGGEEMHFGADLVPAEEQHRQKPRLKEEREDPLGGEALPNTSPT